MQQYANIVQTSVGIHAPEGARLIISLTS